MGLIWLVIVGAAAGFIATRILDMRIGVVPTVLLGIAGALVGSLVWRIFLGILGVFGGLIGAVIGALIVVWIVKTVMARR